LEIKSFYGIVYEGVISKQEMMIKMNFPFRALAACLLVCNLFMASCKKEDDNSHDSGAKARLGVRLTDGPAAYQAIYLDIRQVEIITDANGSVMLTPSRPGIYDILKLRNGIDTLLLNADIAPGTISQIRLILGPNNSLVTNGNTYPLNTPSAQESGLKLNIHETLVAGRSYEIFLDFDAGKSILQTGNGQYKLKPVIRAYTAATDGRIKGYVFPGAALTTVYAVNGSETYSAIPNADGFFQITGLPAGNYQVVLDAELATFQDVTLNNISVSHGTSTDIGRITLLP
jgi:hypothetical protein